MSFMSREPVGGELLREKRRARLVRGTMRLTSGTEIAIVIRNLSERGLGVTSRGVPPIPGEKVTICLPGSPELPGVVRWTRNTAFGVELTGAVDPAEISATLQRELARMQEQTEWKVSSLHRINAPNTQGPRRRV